MHNKHTTHLSSLFFLLYRKTKANSINPSLYSLSVFRSAEQFEMNVIVSLTTVRELGQFHFGLELYFFGFFGFRAWYFVNIFQKLTFLPGLFYFSLRTVW